MKKIVKYISAILAIILTFLGILSIVNLHNNAYFSPEYKKIALDFVLEKTEFSQDDYDLIFRQTGLGKCAVDQIKDDADFIEQVKEYQENFFASHNFLCVREVLTTSMEYSVNERNEPEKAFKMFDVLPGYVLIMESSHSFCVRHGHAGIVLNDSYSLEAPIIGQPTQKYTLDAWEYYPTFIMLRLKDVPQEKLTLIAENAQKQLEGVMYNPLAGVFKKKQGSAPKSVQCAYLVWYAFYNAGYDIDSDGGFLVTVQDIKNSDLFEIVQIYGYNPENFI